MANIGKLERQEWCNLYYWFRVGEGTLQIYHLNSDFTPNPIKQITKKSTQINHGEAKKATTQSIFIP
jgi:hypothetical protein